MTLDLSNTKGRVLSPNLKPVGEGNVETESILKLSGWEPTTSISYGISQMITYWTNRVEGYNIKQLENKLLAR